MFSHEWFRRSEVELLLDSAELKNTPKVWLRVTTTSDRNVCDLTTLHALPVTLQPFLNQLGGEGRHDVFKDPRAYVARYNL